MSSRTALSLWVADPRAVKKLGSLLPCWALLVPEALALAFPSSCNYLTDSHMDGSLLPFSLSPNGHLLRGASYTIAIPGLSLSYHAVSFSLCHY